MWRANLRSVYADFEDWAHHALIYRLHIKLGFKTATEAWEANPRIQGSTNPDDYGLQPAECSWCFLDLGSFSAGFVCEDCGGLFCLACADEIMKEEHLCKECR